MLFLSSVPIFNSPGKWRRHNCRSRCHFHVSSRICSVWHVITFVSGFRGLDSIRFPDMQSWYSCCSGLRPLYGQLSVSIQSCRSCFDEWFLIITLCMQPKHCSAMSLKVAISTLICRVKFQLIKHVSIAHFNSYLHDKKASDVPIVKMKNSAFC